MRTARLPIPGAREHVAACNLENGGRGDSLKALATVNHGTQMNAGVWSLRQKDVVDATAGDRVGLVTRAAAILSSLPGFCRIFPPPNTQRLPIAKLTPEILQDSLIIKFQCLVRPGKPQRRQSASDTACLRLLRSLLLTLLCRCPS